MNEVVHESIYDYCEHIYESICYNNNNCHDNRDILTSDLNNFIENEIEKMSTYNINTILLSYGFDKAFKYYIDNNYDTRGSPGSPGSQGGRQLSDIKNIHSITKTLVYYLIVSSFEIR
jgi:hypothetical protein